MSYNDYINDLNNDEKDKQKKDLEKVYFLHMSLFKKFKAIDSQFIDWIKSDYINKDAVEELLNELNFKIEKLSKIYYYLNTNQIRDQIKIDYYLNNMLFQNLNSIELNIESETDYLFKQKQLKFNELKKYLTLDFGRYDDTNRVEIQLYNSNGIFNIKYTNCNTYYCSLEKRKIYNTYYYDFAVDDIESIESEYVNSNFLTIYSKNNLSLFNLNSDGKNSKVNYITFLCSNNIENKKRIKQILLELKNTNL